MNDAHKAALRRGREKAAAKRRKAGIKRVLAYKAWSKADAEWWANGKRGSRPEHPTDVPQDSDFEAAREAGVIE